MNKEQQAKEDAARCEDCLPRDQAERLFAHAIHEDGIFNSRMHNFLVTQAILIAAVGLLQDAHSRVPFPLHVVSGAALILSFAWWYVQIRQKRKLDVLIRRLEKFLPEFARTRRWSRPLNGCPSATQLLAHVIPISFIVIWSLILGNALFR